MSKIEDRKLLELAAKAYWPNGEASFHFDENEDAIIYIHADNQDHNGLDCERIWNPLDDDGDALRLMVELGLLVAVFEEAEFMRQHIEVSREGIDVYQRHEGGKLSATRRAIVRAAAEIGGLMC